MPILDILIIALVVIALSGLRVAQQYERGVVFRLGRYMGLKGPGLYWIIPLGVERSVRVDIRTRTVSAEQQETITRDSVTIKVNAVLWYRVVDAASRRHPVRSCFPPFPIKFRPVFEPDRHATVVVRQVETAMPGHDLTPLPCSFRAFLGRPSIWRSVAIVS